MIIRRAAAALSIGLAFLIATTLSDMAQARGGGRGRGGGGGFSRSSPASGGSLSTPSASQRPTQPSTRQAGAARRQETTGGQQGDRQDSRTESREDWQKHRDESREDWQDWAEDEHWDDHYDDHTGEAFAAGVVVGASAGAAVAASPTYVTALPCASTAVVVSGVTYYQCGSVWYSRGYESGTVVYLVASPPPGY